MGFPEIPTVGEIFLSVLGVVWSSFAAYWWIIAPPVLFFIFRDIWLIYIRDRYVANIKWVTLEVKVPREIMKTPKAMEQVFAGLGAMQSGGNLIDKWWKGKVQEWVSFEIVGWHAMTRFFIHTPQGFKNLVEAQIFAQYPEAEILEVEDYVNLAPLEVPGKDYDLWGTELIFEKDNAFPIRTYPEFEETQEEKRFDPMSALAEAGSHLKDNEAIWVQFLLKPAAKEWKEKGQESVDKLIGKKKPPKPLGFLTMFILFFGEWISGLWRALLFLDPPEKSVLDSPSKSEGAETKMQFLSPGEKSVVEKVEQKLSKFGFSCTIRILYWGKRDEFSRSNISATLSYFRQFNTLNMNALKPNKEVTPSIDYWMKAQREFSRKVALWASYRGRVFSLKPIVLNAEEIATLYHYPTVFVGSPTVYRIESKKGGPPPTLPIA